MVNSQDKSAPYLGSKRGQFWCAVGKYCFCAQPLRQWPGAIRRSTSCGVQFTLMGILIILPKLTDMSHRLGELYLLIFPAFRSRFTELSSSSRDIPSSREASEIDIVPPCVAMYSYTRLSVADNSLLSVISRVCDGGRASYRLVPHRGQFPKPSNTKSEQLGHLT